MDCMYNVDGFPLKISKKWSTPLVKTCYFCYYIMVL